jgi:hypothetical protein
VSWVAQGPICWLIVGAHVRLTTKLISGDLQAYVAASSASEQASETGATTTGGAGRELFVQGDYSIHAPIPAIRFQGRHSHAQISNGHEQRHYDKDGLYGRCPRTESRGVKPHGWEKD